MQKSFVLLAVDLYKRLGFNQEFRYRAYVNNELFTERTWIWDDRYYLEETLQLDAPPGHYRINVVVLGADQETLQVENIRVIDGPGRIEKDKLILE